MMIILTLRMLYKVNMNKRITSIMMALLTLKILYKVKMNKRIQ